MNISVFLSYPKPCFQAQEKFIQRIRDYLCERGFAPRTLGVTGYDMDALLTTIRPLMLESNGLITIVFRRTYVDKGTARLRTDLKDMQETQIDGAWLTTPSAHIEPATAFQHGLPILILREKRVFADGILEKGVVGLYMPEIDLGESLEEYFTSNEWSGIISEWEGYVRAVVERKARPPELF